MGKAIKRKHLYNNDATLNFLATFAARVSLIQGEWMRNNRAQSLAWRSKPRRITSILSLGLLAGALNFPYRKDY